MIESSLHCTLPGYTVISIPEKKLYNEYEKADALIDILDSWGISPSSANKPLPADNADYQSYKLLRKISALTLLLFMALAMIFLFFFNGST